MSNDSNSPSDGQPNKIGIEGIYVSQALFTAIMDATCNDMPAVYSSAISELGQPVAMRLICGLGASDPTWFKAIPELKPQGPHADPAVDPDGSRTP